MFRIHQHPDIFKTGSQCIVGGYGNYQWFPLRICALAAIRTGVSVIAFASFAAEFPVHGAITITSRYPFGPIGSAS